MSHNLCSLSGKITDHSVICLKTGYIFNKDLIENFIDSTGKCPITQIQITKDDLMEIKGGEYSKPRNINNTSINGLFEMFKNEFDSTVCEVTQLKKEIDNTKKELANSFYKYEASINIINRLIKDKELVRNQMEKYKKAIME